MFCTAEAHELETLKDAKHFRLEEVATTVGGPAVALGLAVLKAPVALGRLEDELRGGDKTLTLIALGGGRHRRLLTIVCEERDR